MTDDRDAILDAIAFVDPRNWSEDGARIRNDAHLVLDRTPAELIQLITVIQSVFEYVTQTMPREEVEAALDELRGAVLAEG